MTWQTYHTTIEGRPGLLSLDRQFAGGPPAEPLHRLAWFGVWCRLDPGDRFWDPAEGERLDELEHALLDLCGEHAHGWGVFVRTLITRGLREYYLYVAAHVDLAPVLVALKARYPDYRVEYDHTADPDWALYRRWLTEPVEQRLD